MMRVRGPIATDDFRGQFSGHETFPLRHLWLRKAYDAVKDGARRAVFSGPEAIETFGVGKNMALSIRYWALACGIIEESDGVAAPTTLGHRLFGGEHAWDPFLEQLPTLWLLQWQVASNPKITTTWYWAFNHFAAQTFAAEELSRSVFEYCQLRAWPRIAEKTVQRDVECFLRSYAVRLEKGAGEDALEPVLAELGLIRAASSYTFEFRRGPKPSLPDGVFAYALHEFWRRYAPDAATLPVEAIAFEPGSPGRVFKLDENSIVERLASLESLTRSAIVWSDTAGVRQAIRKQLIKDPLALLAASYRIPADRRRAA